MFGVVAVHMLASVSTTALMLTGTARSPGMSAS